MGKQDVAIQKIEDNVKYIRKAIEGNGKMGLIEETKINTDYRIGAQANYKLMKFLIGGSWLTTIVAFMFTILKTRG